MHSGTRLLQRGAKAQPAVQAMVSFGEPLIGCSGWSRGASSRGIEASSPPVYGWRGSANSGRRGADSTIRPEYMTCTVSHSPATTPRSWVINSSAVPDSRTSTRRRSRICAWIVTSSAVVGSSAISSRGRQASAIAIRARCRIPPDSWCGYSRSRRAGSGIPTRRSSDSASATASVRDIR